MKLLLTLSLILPWLSLGSTRSTNANTEVQGGEVEARGIPYCITPWRTRPSNPRTFTTHFRTDPIGYARHLNGNTPWISAGNTLMNYRVREVLHSITSFYTVVEVQTPDGHPALHNYNVEIRRVPTSNPGAAGDCFLTGTVERGQTTPTTLRWQLDSEYIYYLTIEES
ncbi:hypothetical protein Q7P35_008222 [Cladosporium inversicolor]